MTRRQESLKINLKGQIAEIVEEHGRSQIKVLVDPFYVTFKDKMTLHLGDKVEIAASLHVEKVKQEFQPNSAAEL